MQTELIIKWIKIAFIVGSDEKILKEMAVNILFLVELGEVNS